MIKWTGNKNSLKTGQTTYIDPVVNENKKNSNKIYRNVKEGKYPSGIFPFIFIWIIFIVCMLIYCLTIDPIKETIVNPDNSETTEIVGQKERRWQDGLWISSGITLCLNFFWLIGRQNFNANIRYGMKKFSHKLRFDYVKFNEPRNNDDYSINRVSNIEEYKEYLKERVSRTKMWFWISFGCHSCLFVVSTIIALTVK